ncbi:carbonate dehydratase [Nostoc piscinale CENA21]|uniref:Carbonic anhydrase n=1 Tax=Nostoc piscinale CENA21 TaxID=224013 RepID=A0A0M4TKD1_9NOSO|nr:carbonic anhydrase [Nostoc piscinale]ALF53386.1 carbonate dehydratase [Nostoc piscinale CENA21]
MSKIFNRRRLLQLLGMTAVGTSVSSCVTSSAAAATNWGYIGKQGPEYWGKLSPDFQLCYTGTRQTPINLQFDSVKSLDKNNQDLLIVKYQPAPLSLVNNGKTIQINYQPGSYIESDRQVYQLLQFHFHHPSEHHLNGEEYDMELHFVHRSQAGNLAVVGVFLKAGEFNPNLQTIWDGIPQTQGKENQLKDTIINAAEFLPTERRFLTYSGSLTTPPCSENVTWYIMETPVEVSSEQIAKFSQLFPHNARPIQPLNQRIVFESVNADQT